MTQRHIASELGIALGLANAYLTRCVKKGYIKIRHVPANRYAYYLTPAGFAEKSHLTAEFLRQSFTFFRNARQECSATIQICDRRGWRRIALAGTSDLAEIVVLCAAECPVKLSGVIDVMGRTSPFMGLPVVDRVDRLEAVDAVIVTDLINPQGTFDALAGQVADERVLTPGMLGIVRPDTTTRDSDGGKEERP